MTSKSIWLLDLIENGVVLLGRLVELRFYYSPLTSGNNKKNPLVRIIGNSCFLFLDQRTILFQNRIWKFWFCDKSCLCYHSRNSNNKLDEIRFDMTVKNSNKKENFVILETDVVFTRNLP